MENVKNQFTGPFLNSCFYYRLTVIICKNCFISFQNNAIKSKIEELKTEANNIDLSDIVIIDSTTRGQLEFIRDSKVDGINFTAFFNEVGREN